MLGRFWLLCSDGSLYYSTSISSQSKIITWCHPVTLNNQQLTDIVWTSAGFFISTSNRTETQGTVYFTRDVMNSVGTLTSIVTSTTPFTHLVKSPTFCYAFNGSSTIKSIALSNQAVTDLDPFGNTNYRYLCGEYWFNIFVVLGYDNSNGSLFTGRKVISGWISSAWGKAISLAANSSYKISSVYPLSSQAITTIDDIILAVYTQTNASESSPYTTPQAFSLKTLSTVYPTMSDAGTVFKRNITSFVVLREPCFQYANGVALIVQIKSTFQSSLGSPRSMTISNVSARHLLFCSFVNVSSGNVSTASTIVQNGASYGDTYSNSTQTDIYAKVPYLTLEPGQIIDLLIQGSTITVLRKFGKFGGATKW